MALMERRVGDWKKKEEPSRLLLVVVCGFMENMILRGLLKIKKQLLKEPRITEMERNVTVGQADISVGVEAPHFDAHIVLDHNMREGGGNQSQWTMTLKDGNFHIPIIEYGDRKRLC
ncbi:hypothetical protein OROGR_007405 [Orobanche gracilis]